MRLAFSLVLLAGISSLVFAQDRDGKEQQLRFGVAPKLKVYPQSTAKKALASTLDAIEKGDVSYLVAHLLDPGFVESRLDDRAKQFEATAEVELNRQRDFQIRNRDKIDPADRLPTDRTKFVALIVQRSREMAFKQLVRDVESKLLNDPQSVKEMQRILTGGMFTDTETGAKATHPDVKDRALYFHKIEDRWYLENHQEDQPPPKKDPGM